MPIFGGDRQRRAVEQALPHLRWRLEDHRHVEQAAARAIQAAGRVGAGKDQVQAQIGRVTAALQHVRAATGPAEKALERTVERIGAAAVNTAASLLPKGLQPPIQIAVHALERALDLVRGPGLGR